MWMWELDHKEDWAPNWCFWTVVLKTLESPLDCKEIEAVNPKGNQSWIFIGRTDADAEAPRFWPPDVKDWPLGKTLMLGKIEGRKRRGRQRMKIRMASPTRCTWVWSISRSWWWTWKPGVLQTMGLQSRTWLSSWTTTRCEIWVDVHIFANGCPIVQHHLLKDVSSLCWIALAILSKVTWENCYVCPSANATQSGLL